MEKKISTIISRIDTLLSRKEPVIIAIDGRCGSGKSTLGKLLAEHYSCDLLHLDDFFLRPEQRSEKRLATPGENVDHERFLDEVLLPIKNNGSAAFRPFDCKTHSLKEPVGVSAGRILIVEGSYCLHPNLREFYNLKIFLTVSKTEQLKRIAARSGEAAAERFERIWIPLEESYFTHYDIQNICDITIGT